MSSFGGSVKLTGENEYKKALADISSNLKVLNSEMKVVTSQYDKNDKSAENLSAQNDVLNKKIEEQKKKVDILSQALEESKDATGENSDKTKKWQTELNNAQAELNKLNREVKENADVIGTAEKETDELADETQKVTTYAGLGAVALKLFGKEMKDLGDETEETGEEEEETAEKTLKLGDIIKANLISDAIVGGIKALANGIKSVGGAMSQALTDGAAYADTFLTLSAQTGLATDTLEKYNAVSELADVSLDTFTGSLTKTKVAMSEAQEGSKKYVEAYKKLGVSVTDADGKMRNHEDVYWETVDALSGMEAGVERDALAMELFGKKAEDLNTIIDMGSEGFKELEQTAVDMGAVLGGKGLEALGKLDDQMQIFKSTTSSTGNILASAFAPAMTDAMGGVNSLMSSVNGLISAVIGGDQEGIDDAIYLVSEGVMDMVDGIQSALPQLMEVASSLISAFIDVIAENLPWIAEEGLSMLASLLSGITKNIGTVVTTVLSVVETLLNTVLENLPMVIEMGIQILVSLIQGITDMLPELIPTVINALLLMVDTLLDNIDLIVESGIELIMALAMGLIEALPDLVEKIPEIIDKLLEAIFDNFPLILDAGIELVLALADGLVKAIPKLVEKAPVLVGKIVKGLVESIPQLIKAGGQLLAGLFEGLLNPKTIWNSVKSLFNGIVGGIKELFGIHSPSTVFRDVVGQNLALGLGEGFEDTMENVTNDMASAVPTEFDATIGTNLNMASGQTQMSTYDMMVSAFKQALTEVKVVMDDREMGGFVTNTVERVVFA